ncbi:hypothetical protein [Bradyrhizobium lablabi]|uniref:hypothetical protein n=1 Tax=Bradyrhizobium lablabi TaxID=722472 RepID=UPI001BA70AE9|nr:hypothetical protein [Bradyrhizobium lablabi]MBR0692882.1 hypothetical protein [Bradyrhizobium lablabi]
MRATSFILAFAVLIVAPSLAGSADSGLPGVGTFSYKSPPVMTPAPMVMAAY